MADYEFGSGMMFSNPHGHAAGQIKILKWDKRVIRLKEKVVVYDDKGNKRERFFGIRNFKRA